MHHPPISCIIPAYNEASRIAAVLEVVSHHPSIQDVIVIDDGSTDGTDRVVADNLDVRLIRMPSNTGKSSAIAAGVRAARNNLLLLVDGDLLGLKPEHLTALIEPVLTGKADVSISLRQNAPLLWRAIGIDFISGERLLPRHPLGNLDEMATLPRFGLEAFINKCWVAAHVRIAVVRLPSVKSPMKYIKRGLFKGLQADVGMLRDIFLVVSPYRALFQIWRMRRSACLSDKAAMAR